MSLFDNVDTGGENTSAPDTSPTDNENTDGEGGQSPESTASWYLDADTPMEGDRPEWLPDKFKTVSDLSKSYNELQKRLGDAPKEYDFTKAQSWLDPEYEGIKEFSDYAREKRVPQDVVDKMMDTVGGYLEQFKPDMSKEREALGENADERLKQLATWAKSNLSEDAFYALTSSMRSADSVQALEEIRDMMINNDTKIPNNEGEQSSGYSIAELETEMRENLDKYKENPQYRDELSRKFEIAHAKQKKAD